MRRLLVLWILASLLGGARAADPLARTAWESAARTRALEPTLLYALALQESARARPDRTAAPWPWAVRTPAGPRYFESAAAARAGLARLLERHEPLALDVGLMQINLHWHGHRVADPALLLEPRVNLEIAADLLAAALASAPGDPVLGIGRYHHWRDEARARAYGRRVLALAAAIRRTGFVDE